MDNAETSAVVSAETQTVDTHDQVQTQVETPASKETQVEGKTYTEADLNRIVQERVARAEEKAQKEADEAKKLARMTAEQKLQHKLDQANAKVAEMERNEAISGLKQAASALLADSGIKANDDLLSLLVTDTAESTDANLKTFLTIVDEKSNEMLQAKLKGSAPKVVTSTQASSAMTREQIMAIPNQEARQKAIGENLSLFPEFS